jgi:hypothetical protein
MRARTLRVSTIGDRSVQASLRRPLPLIVSEPAVTEAMSAGVADSGNTVIGRRPRRSSLSIVPIALPSSFLAANLWSCEEGRLRPARVVAQARHAVAAIALTAT